tara:strand:- start:1018 stop:1731 length:714 start_codon:yes stop_codon:yes gene_type:complete
MRKDVYKRHIDNFDKHWWFESRRNIIEKTLNKNIKKKVTILDYGSGSGVNIGMLSKFGKVNIFEPHKQTAIYLKKKYLGKKYQTLKKISDRKYDLIVLADVLEHIKNDKKKIKELSGKLKKNGKILITVPAYKILFTKKDIILGHYRRYTINEIKDIFKEFKIKKLSYFNFFLFLPISISLIFYKILKSDFIDSVEKKPNSVINFLLFSIFNFESKIINIFNFPFGISILGVFEKND